MTLESVCKEIIEAKKESGKSTYRSDSPELKYEVLAGNHTDKLAQAGLIMKEALEYIRWEGYDRDFWDRINKAKEALEQVNKLFGEPK